MAYNSSIAYGNVTGPAAGGTITSLTGLAGGRYSVVVSTGIEGTGTAPDNNNMALVAPSGTVGTLLSTFGGAGRFQNAPVGLTMTAGGTVLVTAVVTAGTAAIYSAQITATPVALY